MTTIQEIKQAVSRLPMPDLDRFRSWFENFDADAWDKQIEKDVHDGKLDKLANKALEDLVNKQCVEL